MKNYKNLIKEYSAQTGYNYSEMLSDYESETPENQSAFLMQIGGKGVLSPYPQMQGNRPVAMVNVKGKLYPVSTIDNRTVSMDDVFMPKDSVNFFNQKAVRFKKKQQGGGDQASQIIQAFAQATGQDPNAIMQQLQQLSPEEQQAAIQQMAQQLQGGDEQEAVDNPQEEQAEMQQGGYDLQSMKLKKWYNSPEFKKRLKDKYIEQGDLNLDTHNKFNNEIYPKLKERLLNSSNDYNNSNFTSEDNAFKELVDKSSNVLSKSDDDLFKDSNNSYLMLNYLNNAIVNPGDIEKLSAGNMQEFFKYQTDKNKSSKLISELENNLKLSSGDTETKEAYLNFYNGGEKEYDIRKRNNLFEIHNELIKQKIKNFTNGDKINLEDLEKIKKSGFKNSLFKDYDSNLIIDSLNSMVSNNSSSTENNSQTGGYDLQSLMGYRDDSPFRHKPSNFINSNSIDMNNTGIPLLGVSNTGHKQFMPPYSGEYQFEGDSVTEYPLAQTGVSLQELKQRYAAKFNIDVNKLPKNLDLKGLLNLAYINRKRLNDDSFIAQLEETVNPKGRFLPNGLEYNKIFENKNPVYGVALNEVVVKGKKTTPELSDWASNLIGSKGKFQFPYKPGNIPVTKAAPGETPADKNPLTAGKKKGGYEAPIPTDKAKMWNDAWRNSGKIPPAVWDQLSNKEKQDFVFDFADQNTPYTTLGGKDKPQFKDRYDARNKFVDGIIGKRTVQILPPATTKPGLSPGMFTATPEEAMAQADNEVAPGQTPPTSGFDLRALELGQDSTHILPTVAGAAQTIKQKNANKFKFNFNNPLESIANNVALTQAFSPVALPYMQQVRIKAAETPLIDERGYIQQINNVFNPIKSNINANSTTGQAYLASLAGQESQKVTETLNEITTKNQQIMAQNNTARVQAMNQEFAGNEAARASYYNEYLQNNAARDSAISGTLAGIAQSNERKIAQQNALESTLMNTLFLNDETSDLDRLLGKRSIGLDKVSWQKYLNTQITPNNIIELDGKQYRIVDGKPVLITAQTGLNRFLKKKLHV